MSAPRSGDGSEASRQILQELGRLEAKIDEIEQRQEASQSARLEEAIVPQTDAEPASVADSKTGARNESDVQHQ